MILLVIFVLLTLLAVVRADGKWKLWNSLIILGGLALGFGVAYIAGMWSKNMALGGEIAVPTSLAFGCLAAVLVSAQKESREARSRLVGRLIGFARRTMNSSNSRVLGLALTLLLTGALIACRSSAPNPDSLRKTREAVLKQDLQTMRQAIDNYTMDKKQAPRSLQDLVDAHYLHEIPVDPVCEKIDWTPHFGDTVLPDKRIVTGLDDVFSGCNKSGSSGTPYTAW
jgi:general secretion pathway protein G